MKGQGSGCGELKKVTHRKIGFFEIEKYNLLTK